MPHLLVTGASGFIGTDLRRALEARGISYSTHTRTSAWPSALATDLDLSTVDAVVHLATPRVLGTDSWDHLVQDTLIPLQGLIGAIRRTNPRCCLVFVSSQSAGPDTPSFYGRLKWQSEQLLSTSGCSFVVIRPGLVIGAGNRGLFSTLIKVVRSSPVIPLIGRGDHLIQPVGVGAVTEAIIRVCLDLPRHAGGTYQLALAPVRLRELLEKVAQALGKARIFIPIPQFFVRAILWLGEKVLKSPPLTRVNLSGLLNLQVMETRESLERLGLQLPSLEESLAQALAPDPVGTEARYLTARLFSRALDERSVERYRDACRLLPASPEDDLNMKKIVARRLDVEAIEYALRRRGSQLTKRIQILGYLLEFRADCFDLFVNTRKSRVAAFVGLGFSVALAVYKMLKGRYLVWRYRLV
jgi:nucleoside-diphosphate-sugar epimerase